MEVADLTYPAAQLPSSVATALDLALDDEYKALATYQATVESLGAVRPFIMIIRAEEQHIAALKALYDKYSLEIPANRWLGNIASPSTLQQACSDGVQAEIANAALYQEQLLPQVVQYPDITSVFMALSQASEQKHLPAFEKCQ
ncbi:DUF2202 domain-containing protein [Candidatus Beckwithbacteria bacterium]|nr:DUF2202 domain-containing protein [Candidatus Beckwithbacteria bacterium]